MAGEGGEGFRSQILDGIVVDTRGVGIEAECLDIRPCFRHPADIHVRVGYDGSGKSQRNLAEGTQRKEGFYELGERRALIPGAVIAFVPIA